MNPSYDMPLSDMKNVYARSLILKCLARGGYGIAGTSHTPNTVGVALEMAKRAAECGRVIDLGIMDYKASIKAAEIGTSMLASGHVGHPFQKGYWVIGENTFSKAQDKPASTIVMVVPDPDDATKFAFAEAALTKHNDVVIWYLGLFDNGALEIVYDSIDPMMREAMAEKASNPHPASSYAVGMNACFAAVAVCNTRGIEYKRHNPQKGGKRVLRAGHVRFDTKPYFTALTVKKPVTDPVETGGRRSPIPHLRRGHVRTYENGTTRWIRDMLVNCKSEDDLAFTEGRQAYVVRPNLVRTLMKEK